MTFQFVLEGLLYLRPCVLRIRRGKEIIDQRCGDSPEGYPVALTLVGLAFTSIGSFRFVEEFGILFAKPDEFLVGFVGIVFFKGKCGLELIVLVFQGGKGRRVHRAESALVF